MTTIRSFTGPRAPWLRACALGLCVLIGGALPSLAEESFSAAIGAGQQALGVDQLRDAKASEYRDLRDGGTIDFFTLAWHGLGDGWLLDASGTKVLQLDQRYAISVQRPGLLSAEGYWRGLPHQYSNGATWLHSGQPGNYTMSNALRQAIEDAATSASPPVPLSTLMPQILDEAGRPLALSVQREQMGLGLTSRLGPGWELEAAGSRETRNGERRISTGTYIRQQAVAGDAASGSGFFDRERFIPRGLELPEPLRYEVLNTSLATSWRRQRGFVSLGWNASRFSNDITSLIWDNPFEAGPPVASSADRGRFAEGGLDLAPDNVMNRLHASAAIKLPARSRLSGLFAYAVTTQDDDFMAFTRNDSIRVPNRGNALATDRSLLPAASLDGELKSTRSELRLVSRPQEKLTLRGSYRSYALKNESPQLFFPGYAAFGESWWRAGIGQKIAGRDTLFTVPAGYERRVLSAGASYRLLPAAKLDAEFARTTWDYDERQVESTSEDAWQAALHLDPSEWAALSVGFLASTREFEGEYEIGLETSRIRQWDVWNRDRTRYHAELDLMPAERWNCGLAWSTAKDEYPGVVPTPEPLPESGNIFESYPYGLNEANSASISVTIGYDQERWSLAASGGRDTSEWKSLAVTKTVFTGDTNLFDPENRWERNQDDTVDWLALAMALQAVPEKLRLSADLALNRYEGTLRTTNPGTPTINSAVAYDFPDFTARTVSAQLGLSWALRENMDFIARYWFEPFRMEDWQWDAMQPYMQGVIMETADSADDFREENVSRYLFLDSRYGDYTIQALSAGLSLRF